MAIFMIVADKQDEVMKQRLQDNYPDNYPYHENDRVFLVRTNDITEEIAAKLGIKGDDEITNGVVLKLDRYYAGYTSNVIWEWLEKES